MGIDLLMYKDLFNSIELGVVYQDIDGTIINANPAAEKILGITREQMCGLDSSSPSWQAVKEDGSDFPGEEHPSMVALSTGERIYDVVMGLHNPELKQKRWIRINAVPEFKEGETKPFRVFTTFNDITELKQAQEETSIAKEKVQKSEIELQKSVDELEAIINALPGMVSVVDKDFTILSANLEVMRIFGHSNKDEVIGKKCYIIRKGLKEACPQCAIKESFEKGHIVDRVSLPEEEEMVGIATKAYAIPLKDKDGNIWGGVEVIMDVSDLRRIEKEVQESEVRFRTIIEKAADAVYLSDMEGRIVNVNQQAEKDTGFTREELLNKTVMELDHVYVTLDKCKEVWSGLKPGSSQKLETYHLRKDGSKFPVELNISAFEIKGEKHILGFARNIAERRKAERIIKESEEKFKNIFNQSPIGIGYYNPKGECIEINEVALDMFGIKEKKYALGFKLFEDPNITKKFLNDLQKGKTINYVSEFDFEIVKKHNLYPTNKTGRIITKVVISPVYDPDQKLLGYIGQVQDITDQKKTEETMQIQNEEYIAVNEELHESIQRIQKINLELEQAKLKAEESDRLKSAFLANMSHEIRTPMNGILGFAELLKDENINERQRKKYIKIIEQSGNRMLNIISDLIDISKIEAGQVIIQKQRTDINQIIESLYNFFKPEADAKDILLKPHTRLSNDRNIINTDKTKLSQILTNLIKNALKYTDAGYIEFGYTLENSYLLFYVKDTGIGISNEYKKKIFKRFNQGELIEKRISEGTGLGLSISKAFVELLGGNIWLESESGKGSEFYFTIPYEVEIEQVVPSTVDTKTKIKPIQKMTILIAEDDEISNLYFKEILDTMNITLLHVKDGSEAVKYVESNPEIKLVLMDIKMPVMDGFIATKKIKEHRPDLPVIAQTAFAFEEDREKSLNAGCDDFIAKPIEKEKIIELIEKYGGT